MRRDEIRFEEICAGDFPVVEYYDRLCVALRMAEYAVITEASELALANAVGFASRD